MKYLFIVFILAVLGNVLGFITSSISQYSYSPVLSSVFGIIVGFLTIISFEVSNQD